MFSKLNVDVGSQSIREMIGARYFLFVPGDLLFTVPHAAVVSGTWQSVALLAGLPCPWLLVGSRQWKSLVGT